MMIALAAAQVVALVAKQILAKTQVLPIKKHKMKRIEEMPLLFLRMSLTSMV